MSTPATKLACQACAAPLDPDDGVRAGGALRCRFCGAFTRVEGAARLASLRGVAGRPRAIAVEDTGGGVRITRRWYSPAYLVLLFFCFVWNGAIGLFLLLVVRGSGVPWFVLLFPVVHVTVGLGLVYFTLSGFVNRTVVEAERGHALTVRHGPLPWPGAATLDAGAIAQLFVTATRRVDRDGDARTSYALAALTKDGARVPVLRTVGLPLEDALFLEQELERHLGLRDVPVAGEVARDGG